MPRMVNKRTRYLILRRDEYKCYYCGVSADDSQMHLDHIVPYSKGGATDPSNLVTACMDCNLGKSTLSAGNVEGILKDISERNIEFELIKKIEKTEKKKKRAGRKSVKQEVRVEFNLETELENLVQYFLSNMTDIDISLLQEIYEKGEYNELEEGRGFYQSTKGEYTVEDIFDRTCQFIHSFAEEEFKILTGYTPMEWSKLKEQPVNLIKWQDALNADVYYKNIKTSISQRPFFSKWNNKDKTMLIELNCSYRPFYERFIQEVMAIPKPAPKYTPEPIKGEVQEVEEVVTRPGFSIAYKPEFLQVAH